MTASLADIHYLTITELAARLRTPAISPVEVTRTKLQRIDALDGELASFGHLTAEDALDAARRAKREIGHDRYRRLHGVPLAIKDLSGTEDAPAAAGMPIHRHFRPVRDATAKGAPASSGRCAAEHAADHRPCRQAQLGPATRQPPRPDGLCPDRDARSLDRVPNQPLQLRASLTMTLHPERAQHLPDLLGIELDSVGAEAVIARLAIRSELLGPTGYLHAATLVALADTACGYGTLAGLPDAAPGFTTLELKTNLLATADHGMLMCRAQRRHGGATTQVWDAEVSCDKRVLALFRCTQLVLDARPRTDRQVTRTT